MTWRWNQCEVSNSPDWNDSKNWHWNAEQCLFENIYRLFDRNIIRSQAISHLRTFKGFDFLYNSQWVRWFNSLVSSAQVLLHLNICNIIIIMQVAWFWILKHIAAKDFSLWPSRCSKVIISGVVSRLFHTFFLYL